MGDAHGSQEHKCWLMKAEPDSRIVKGKDVAFSVDHFEAMGTSHWDGVRNALAKRFMKDDMKIGDKVLFYHSNTKLPGVAALAEVAKEGYPDHTAWDPDHPYYDIKSREDKPVWYMVDILFKTRLAILVPLKLYKYLAELPDLPEALHYLSQEHLLAIKAMPLINRGRLSVQPVSQLAYDATILLAENGGFEELLQKADKKAAIRKKLSPVETEDLQDHEQVASKQSDKKAVKRKLPEVKELEGEGSEPSTEARAPVRRSTRTGLRS